ncbi:MAG: septum formation initiator family protein [Hominimerdicola sp.]
MTKNKDVTANENGADAKKTSRLFKPFMIIMMICFVLYAMVQIIYQQAQIAELKKQSEVLNNKISEAKQVNDEYSGMLNSDEREYMERIAVEKLGYAYPNERRFYLVNGTGEEE